MCVDGVVSGGFCVDAVVLGDEGADEFPDELDGGLPVGSVGGAVSLDIAS